MQRNSWKNNILHWKKHYTVECGGKKISNSRAGGPPTPEVWKKELLPQLNHPYPLPHKSPIVMSTIYGVGEKRIWHLSKCHASTKWLARVQHVVVFKTKVLHFKIVYTRIKGTNGKRKFNGMLSSLFVDKRKLFAMKLSFEEFKLVSTRRIVALGLFWTNQGSEDSEETWATFCTLWSRKVRF